jgi:hypothetical protein
MYGSSTEQEVAFLETARDEPELYVELVKESK